MKRTPLTKKVRFNIFKRDQFKCQYCGATPPAVILQIDHINPVSKGGLNDIDNLLTSCQPCNIGKSNNLLSDIPKTLQDKHAELIEKEEQIKAYNRLLKSKKNRENKLIDNIEISFQQYFPNQVFTDKFRESIRINFLSHFTEDDLIASMRKASIKCKDPHNAIKYFCGICWNIIKGKNKK